MKKFVFITTRNQHQYDHPLRSRLWTICLNTLQQQQSDNWEALVVGLDEKQEGNITYLKATGDTKKPKIKQALEYIAAQETPPEYLIRLDDDDLISATMLKELDGLKSDAFTDKYHLLYDITTGKSLQNDHTWFPNTCILGYQHAIQPFGPEQMPLFMYDHDKAWHQYFEGKNVGYAAKNNPVYLRIISPSTVSISGTWDKSKDYDQENFDRYVQSLRKWRRINFWRKRSFKGLDAYEPDLAAIREMLFSTKK